MPIHLPILLVLLWNLEFCVWISREINKRTWKIKSRFIRVVQIIILLLAAVTSSPTSSHVSPCFHSNGKIILIVNFCICYSEVISCRHLLQVGEETNHNYPDAVYKIYPIGSQPIMAYCDMSRDGGGWTLLVTSHTNSWTAQNVKLRNANSPKLTDDYSILQYADSIKDNIKVAGSTFEYRLEAQSRGNSLYSRNLVPFQTGRAGVG